MTSERLPSFDAPPVIETVLGVQFAPLENWQIPHYWPSVFPLLGKMSDTGFLPKPESLKFNASYQMPEQKGRLRITANHAVRRNDGAELIVLTLTARGKPDSSQLDDIMKWLDLGREWVVRGFTDFTSETLHQLWGRNM